MGELERQAPRGKFRLVEILRSDPFGRGFSVVRDFDKKQSAIDEARSLTKAAKKDPDGNLYYVYDDAGNYVDINYGKRS
jgi:hypothetical protein